MHSATPHLQVVHVRTMYDNRIPKKLPFPELRERLSTNLLQEVRGSSLRLHLCTQKWWAQLPVAPIMWIKSTGQGGSSHSWGFEGSGGWVVCARAHMCSWTCVHAWVYGIIGIQERHIALLCPVLCIHVLILAPIFFFLIYHETVLMVKSSFLCGKWNIPNQHCCASFHGIWWQPHKRPWAWTSWLSASQFLTHRNH